MSSKTKKFIEEWHPTIISIIIGAIITLIFKSIKVTELPKELYASSISLFGILIGFLMTSRTLAVGQNENYFIEQIKIAKKYRRFIEFFMISIRWCFVSLILSISGLILDFSNPKDWHYAFIFIWVFSTCQSFITCYRINTITTKIIGGK